MSPDGEFSAVSWLDWMDHHSERLGIRFSREQRGLAKLGPFFLIRVFAEFRGLRLQGSGYGRSEVEALLAGSSELMERAIMHANAGPAVQSSNGFAAHTAPQLAQQNAAFELFERDALLCHSLTGVPFKTLDPGSFPQDFSRILVPYVRQGLRIHAGMMNARGPGKGIVIILDGHDYHERPFGVFLSTAYGLDWKAALNKAMTKALWDFVLGLERPSWNAISLSDFHALPDPEPRDHGRYALSPDKQGWTAQMFAENPNWAVDRSGPLKISLKRYSIPSEFAGAPLHVFQASSHDMQTLYFGRNRPDVLNVARLERFAGLDVDLARITEIEPHFMD